MATAIRLNSPYRSDYVNRDPSEYGLDVMWLADSLLSYYRMFTESTERKDLKDDPNAIFEQYGHLCRPREAMAVFTDIREIALSRLNCDSM